MQTLELVDADSGVEFARGVHLDVRFDGEGPRVALVLPGAEGREEDAAFLAGLAEDYSVVTPSHPGFGLSPRPAWCTSVDDLADIYLGWLERTGASVTLVGLQFGGWVALRMAARSTARISRLVLVDSLGVKLGAPTDREIADVFALSHAEVHRRLYADPAFGLGDLSEAPLDDVLEMARNDEALATYGWQPYMHTPGLAHVLDRIDIPTLVVWGAQDGIVAPEYGRGLAERIPGARFAQIEDAGHRAQVERPDDVARLISAHAG